ncbi:MAG TPA: GNAT family N-acetyltransferase [Microlunatus sp.]
MTNSTPRSGDAVQIRNLQASDQVPSELPTPRPDEDHPRWRRTLLAIDSGNIVGTAALALATVTDSYFCEINVLPTQRRQRIGTRLYAAIYQRRDHPFPVLTRAMRSQPLRRTFAESLGSKVRTHCPEPWIDPPTDQAQQWINQQSLPGGYTTVTMAEQPTQKILQAWTTYYVWAHEAFGTVHANKVPLTWEGYSQGLDPAASMITLDQEGRIVAFSLVSPDVWDGRTMIVSETVQHDQPDGSQLLKATVAQSLSVLGERGVHRVELEGHSTDPHSPDLVNSLPAGEGDPMDILELDSPTS